MKLRKKWLICLPPLYCALVIALIAGTAIKTDDSVSVRVYSDNSGETLALRGGNGAVICDIGTGASAQVKNAYSGLNEEGVTELQALMLTHYHSKHINLINTLSGQFYIREIWIPEPVNSSDASAALKINELCDSLKIKCRMYNPGETLTVFGNTEITSSGSGYIGRSTHPVGIITVERNGESLLYLSNSVWEYGGYAEWEMNGKYDYVYYGGHGPKTKQYNRYTEAGKKTTVFADDTLLLYNSCRDTERYSELCSGNVAVCRNYRVYFRSKRLN